MSRHSTRTIKAVIFDLDGTLWDVEPVLAEAERRLHEWFATYHPAIADTFSIEDLRKLRRELAEASPHLRHDMSALRKASVRVAADKTGVDPLVSERAFEVFMRHRNRVELYHDVRPALERLCCRYTLCSLTNGNADVEMIGLSEFFHHSLSAANVGAAKPAPEMFLEVCRVAGTQPSETVHVGDEPETDIAGAAAVGCRTVWVNRSNLAWTREWRADAEIVSLDELESLLESWQNAAD
ncbi:MAG: HAD family hydrolase [Acidiferrobacterales bacterium]